jgi:hypothetical protein
VEIFYNEYMQYGASTTIIALRQEQTQMFS